jgi:hypothetical protein
VRSFRVFLQLNTLWELGDEAGEGPLDEDHLDVQQGFVELGHRLGDAGTLAARAGRQELSFGSGRFMSIRNAPNLRRSFDAGRVWWKGSRYRFDVVAGTAVEPEAGILDDMPDETQLTWIGHGTADILANKRLSADAYYVGVTRDARQYQDASGDETRHMVGARIAGASGGVDHDVEGMFQLGQVGSSEVQAWRVAVDAGWSRRIGAATLRTGARADVVSGDDAIGDGVLETFDPLFPKQEYFDTGPLITPSNLYNVHPIVSLAFAPVTVEAHWNGYWRFSTDDAVYRPNGTILVAGDVSSERFIGHSLAGDVEFRVGRHVSLTLHYYHFWLGDLARDALGQSVDFFTMFAEYTF